MEESSSSEFRLLEREIIFTLTERNYGLNAIVGRIFELIKSELARSAKNYDYIIVDGAQGISAVTEACIRLADLVIVPTASRFYATLTGGHLGRRDDLGLPCRGLGKTMLWTGSVYWTTSGTSATGSARNLIRQDERSCRSSLSKKKTNLAPMWRCSMTSSAK